MKHRDKIIIGIVVACLAVAAGTWMDVRQGRRMHAALELALAQNRSGVPFRSDTIYLDADSTDAVTLHHVVDFYRHPLRRFLARHASFLTPHSSLKGEADNSSFVTRHSSFVTRHSSFLMQSLYVLGCVHRDLHEAPLAIVTWEEAIAAADTTADDCDYATLYRVYGQMAEVYFRQNIPEKQLAAQQKYCDYALLAGDTLTSIRGLLQKNDAYLSLGDTTAVFDNIEYVRHLYFERGLTKEAAQVYPSAIQIALNRGEYEKAGSMMQIFEKESGLFDEEGNIERTREIYYYRKGAYFLGTNQLDSAERQFRRLLDFEPNLVDAYRGLLCLYESKRQPDSIFKYARLYEKTLERYLEDTHTYAITQAEALFDYSQQQEIAQKQNIKARRRGIVIVCITIISMLSFLLITLYYQKKRKKGLQALLMARNSYIEAKKELGKLQQEITYLKQNLPIQKETEDLLDEKETIRQELLVQMTASRTEMGIDNAYAKDEKSLMNSAIVNQFKQMANPHTVRENGKVCHKSPRPFTDDEWDELVEEIKKYHYGLYYFITVKHKLPKRQFKVCILTRLYFSNQEMAALMNTSFSNISNLRSKVTYALFGSKDLSLLDDLLRDI